MRQKLMIVALVLVVAIVSAQRGYASDANKLFPQPAHDFGTVARGAQLVHRYAWTNNEKQRIEVTEIRSSCQCVTAVAVPKALEPGQSGVIEVTLDAKKFVGEKTFSIYVVLGPKQLREATLSTKAHVRPDVVFNPGQVSFGTLAEGVTATQTLDVEYAGKLDWKITELTCGCAFLETSYEEAYRKPGEVGYRIKVNLKANAPVGEFKHEIRFKTNDPNVPTAAVLVEGAIKPSIAAAPSPVDFGEGRKNRAVTRKLTVRGEKPFEIVKVETVGDGLTAAASTGNLAAHVITLSWTPKSSSDLAGEVVIHTNSEKCPIIRVPVHGQAP